VKKKQK